MIRICTIEDARYIAENMRQCDLDEFYKVTGEEDPLPSILSGIDAENSICYCFESNGNPFAIVGSIEKQDYQVVWACGTNEVKKNARLFINGTKDLLKKHKHNFKPYVNYVDAENKDAIKYLKFVGFILLDPIPYGKLNANFLPFIMG